MGCYCCNEPLSSYGFPIIEGVVRKVCINCEHWKSYYQREKMGTPNNFNIGDKVYGLEYKDEWYPAIIYSIEIVKTPKGEMYHYLCYYEHYSCYDKNKEIAEDFGWFKEIKKRDKIFTKLDCGKEYCSFNNTYKNEIKKFGEIKTITIPKKILDWVRKEEQPQIEEKPRKQLTLLEMGN